MPKLLPLLYFSQIVANNNAAQSSNAVNFSLKTPDDQWIYCETRGCSFWTRKPERMIRHRQCHRPDTKYYKCPDCSLRLVDYTILFFRLAVIARAVADFFELKSSAVIAYSNSNTVARKRFSLRKQNSNKTQENEKLYMATVFDFV